MKCYICDAQLGKDEIKMRPKYGHGGFEPCGHCLSIIEEVFEPLNEEEIDRQIDIELSDGLAEYEYEPESLAKIP